MATELNKKVIKLYASPEMIVVELDKDISLALESTPPIGPLETYNSIKNIENNALEPYI